MNIGVIQSLRHYLGFMIVLGFTLLGFGEVLAAEVNVYSYRQEFLMKPLMEFFERDTGIKANVIFASKGLIARLRAEGEDSPADVLLATDVSRLEEAREGGLLQSTNSAVLNRNIPSQYRQKDGYWYGLSMRARVIYASKERVKPDEIAYYTDLAKPTFDGRLCSRSARHDYNVSLIAAYIAHNGVDKAKQWMSGFAKNLAQEPQGNDRAQVRFIKEGICDMALVNTYYMGKMLENAEQKSWADAVYLIFPRFADGGTHINVSGAGVVKGAKNRDEALRFIEFMSSPEAQKMYAEINFEYPVAPNIEWSNLVSDWGAFTPDNIPLEDLYEYRQEALILLDQIGLF